MDLRVKLSQIKSRRVNLSIYIVRCDIYPPCFWADPRPPRLPRPSQHPPTRLRKAREGSLANLPATTDQLPGPISANFKNAFPFPRVKTEGYRGLTSLNGAVKFVRQRSNRVKGAKGKGSASATFLVLMKSLSGDASRRASRRLLGAALTNQSSSDRV
ncbi:hypothetical protein THAOC_15538 [Thalassiosira oceanica]|uniref:Uncharacterized protein n=1 Tax=Thalassiosira oceanica TaxID=159749 RepID=K0SEM9_THAOC|nr:hypothetical protein THAOC_15538 [Thalassiosira oceanica]|eukprot:EJK63785.1 hypothetical protein THAOC_15538 [Thalassiosira oceanica]